MERERLTLTDALLSAADVVATNEYIAQIEHMHKQACKAAATLRDIEIEDVYNYGCSVELDKLKRNAAALHTLLSMAQDAALYVKSGIHAIFEARDQYELDQVNKHREALRREEAYLRKQKANAKQREKRPVNETGDQ